MPLHEILIGVTLSYALGALATYPPISAALVLGLALSFVAYVLWLKSRPRAEAPEIRGLRAEVSQLREDHDVLKNKLDGIILGGRHRGG